MESLRNNFRRDTIKNKIRKQVSTDQKFRRTTRFDDGRRMEFMNLNQSKSNEEKDDSLQHQAISVQKLSRLEKLKKYKEMKKKNELEKKEKSQRPMFKVTRVPSIIGEIPLPEVDTDYWKNVKSKVNSNVKIRPAQTSKSATQVSKAVPDNGPTVNHQFKIPDNHQFKVPKIISSNKVLPPTSMVTRSKLRNQNISNFEGLRQHVNMKKKTFFNSLPETQIFTSTFLHESSSTKSGTLPAFPKVKDISIIKPLSSKIFEKDTTMKSISSDVPQKDATIKSKSPIPEKCVIKSVALDVLEKDATIKSESSIPEKDGAYFERILDSEIDRLENRCKCWDSIVAENSQNIPKEILDEIDSSIGQTRLLIKKKFEQFRGLTRGNCEKKITSDDLQGFWDMIYMQVINLDERFGSLENKKSNNWEQQDSVVNLPVKNKIIEVTGKKSIRTKVGPSAGLKAAIAAARKKKLESQCTENNDIKVASIETESSKELKDVSANYQLDAQNSDSFARSVLWNTAKSFQNNETINETKEINNSVNKNTSETAMETQDLETNRVRTRRHAFANLKQEKIDVTQSSSCSSNTSQDNSSVNKSSSFVRNKKKRGTIYNLLYGKDKKSENQIVPPAILTPGCSTNIPTNEFNAGFFTIVSPHKNCNTMNLELKTTPKRPSIRKSLLSEKKQNRSPGLFMMRASFGAKIAELNTSIEKCSINSGNGS